MPEIKVIIIIGLILKGLVLYCTYITATIQVIDELDEITHKNLNPFQKGFLNQFFGGLPWNFQVC
jgi:hypothetical protein